MQNTNIDKKDLSDGPVHLELASEALGAPQRAARTTEGGRRAARAASIIAEIDNGFSEQELRLQKALAILMTDRSCMLKIGDVASSCGFNEVSYFHRCFRRRFGAAPAQLRAKAAAK
jgi:AraC-like DNA-binding protein